MVHLFFFRRLEQRLQRRVASAPRNVLLTVRRRRAVLQVEAGNPIVELRQEGHRVSAGCDKVAKVDVRHVPLRHCERLIERRHAALQMRVIRRVDLLLFRERANPLELRDVVGQLQRRLRAAKRLRNVEDVLDSSSDIFALSASTRKSSRRLVVHLRRP